MSSRKLHARAPDAGLTLVELLITIVVASLISASTFTLFAGQQRVYDLQSKMVNLQQNVTLSMELLVRFARAAGNGMSGCVRPDSDEAGPDTGAPAPVGPALPLSAAPATGLRVFLRGSGVIRVPPLWITNGANGGPDTLTVAFAAGSFGSWRDADLGADIETGMPTAPLKWPATPDALDNSFRVEELVLVLDASPRPFRPAPLYNDRGCALFNVTQVDKVGNELRRASTSQWNPATDAEGANLIPFKHQAGGVSAIRHFGTLNWIRFAIRPATPGAPPALTMQRLDQGTPPEVVSEGIEDLQVAYACDNNPNDGLLREGPDRQNDEWVLNAPGEPIPAGCGKPEAVRITLTGRSLTQDTLLSAVAGNAKPAIEDGSLGPADQFRRRSVTTTIYPRN